MYNTEVTNGVRFAGKIVGKQDTGKTVIISLDTGAVKGSEENNFPQVVVFQKIKAFTENLNIGDFVLIDATVQSNPRNEDKPYFNPRTMAVNHITKINRERYINRFNFFGRALKVEKLSDTSAIAKIKLRAGKDNFIKIYFEGTESDVNDFVNLRARDFVYFNGHIAATYPFNTFTENRFYADKCICTGFKVLSVQKSPSKP